MTPFIFSLGAGLVSSALFVLGYKIGRATERERARGYAAATTSGPLRVVRRGE